jgi:chromosome segregation ATPase
MTDEIKQILKSHGEQLDLIATKVVEHDDRLDRITRAVVDNTQRLDKIDEKLEQVATKEDISRMTNTLDRIVKLTEKKDQELTFVTHDMKDFDDRLEKVEHDVKKMKPALGVI